MAKQLYYEDVAEGTVLPPLVKHPTLEQHVKWAGVSGDYYAIHYDKDFAQKAGYRDVVVYGWLKFSFLAQLVGDWMGEGGTIKKIGVSYRGLNFPGEDITCRGKVTKKYAQEDEHYIECEIWTENPEGEKGNTGSATLILPSKEERERK